MLTETAFKCMCTERVVAQGSVQIADDEGGSQGVGEVFLYNKTPQKKASDFNRMMNVNNIYL